MTLKYPSSGYGMSAPSAASNVMNKLAASNNAAAGTSSWKMPTPQAFPSLKGATGNNLYPAPKTSSFSSFSTPTTNKSVGASAYPSVNDYLGKLTAPKASSSASSSFNYPSLSLPNRPSGGITGGAGQSPFSLLNYTPGSSGAASGGSAAFSMPSGFSSGALGGGATRQQPMAAAPSQPARAPQATPQAAPAPARTSQPQAPLPSVAQQGLNKYGTPPKGPGVYKTAQEAAYHSGYINNGGVNKDFAFTSTPDANGNYYVTAKTQPQVAMKPPTVARQAPPKAAPPPIVGRPTQGHQPVSTPVVAPRPSAWAPPPMTQDQIDEANQGRWLG